MIGKLLCMIGRHDWQPVPGTEGHRYISKWQRYETALGKCSRCKIKHNIQKEIYY